MKGMTTSGQGWAITEVPAPEDDSASGAWIVGEICELDWFINGRLPRREGEISHGRGVFYRNHYSEAGFHSVIINHSQSYGVFPVVEVAM